MKAVIQRVKRASVKVERDIVGNINEGILVLLAVAKDDTILDASFLAEKIIHLRIFEDEAGKMNRSLKEIDGEMLVVSQFTLHGDCRKGRRPSFEQAADPKKAEELYGSFVDHIKKESIPVQTGRFRAMMEIELVNDGPVTFVLDSKKE